MWTFIYQGLIIMHKCCLYSYKNTTKAQHCIKSNEHMAFAEPAVSPKKPHSSCHILLIL